MSFLIENFFKEISNEKFDFIFEQYQTGGLGKIVRKVVSDLQQFDEDGNKSLWDVQNFIDKKLNLKFIDSGTQRAVFDIDGDYVLKLAMNLNGINANKTESNMNAQGLLRDLVPRVYISDPNYKWIIMDRIEPEKDEEKWFRDFFGSDINIDYIVHFAINLSLFISRGNSINQSIELSLDKIESIFGSDLITPEVKEALLDAPLLHKLIRAVSEFGTDFSRVIGDLYYKNMGRDSQGNPIIIDWG